MESGSSVEQYSHSIVHGTASIVDGTLEHGAGIGDGDTSVMVSVPLHVHDAIAVRQRYARPTAVR